MPIDPRYVLMSDLQSLFRDKDTGLPLRNGEVYFWKDDARNVPKPVYTIDGSPPNYTYVALPNPVVLTAAGTFSDSNNNDIVPYWFPYDSTDPDANIELYYVEVYDEDGVLQFTRQAWPNTSSAGQDEQNFENYIPDGQFLVHTNLAADDTYDAGEIRAPVTVLSQGGWTFERPAMSSATNFVTFDRFDSPIGAGNQPTGNPRYACHVTQTGGGAGDTFKDVRIKFQDVNRFASDNQDYTFAFTARTNAGSSTSVQLILIKNFGTGGDSQTETPITTFIVGNSYEIYQYPFIIFGDNSGKNIGDNDDDFVQLALRFPLASNFDVSFTDGILTFGSITITNYPTETHAEVISKAIDGWTNLPAYDGSNLYLPKILTATGYQYDTSEIGDVIAESQLGSYSGSLSTITNRMIADGSTYQRIDFSPLGIPYQRLFNAYFDTTVNIPLYGTGEDYFTAVFDGTGNEFRIITNYPEGAITDTTDVNTGFTFYNICEGAGGLFAFAYWLGTNKFLLRNNEAAAVTAVNAGTSTFTVTTLIIGSAITNQTTLIETVAAAALTGVTGKYFTFVSYGSASNHPFYVWYQITTEADPMVPAHTGIKIKLNAADTSTEVAEKTRECLCGFKGSAIQTNAASTLTAGDYFLVYVDSGFTPNEFYVWYTINGTGTDPAPIGKTGIQVDVLSSDTNTIVATKTQIAINSRQFSVPDDQGQFLRGLDIPGNTDPGYRLTLVPGFFGNTLGTFEFDDLRAHLHEYQGVEEAGAAGGDAGGTFIDRNTTPTGGNETRPINKNVRYVIKY